MFQRASSSLMAMSRPAERVAATTTRLPAPKKSAAAPPLTAKPPTTSGMRYSGDCWGTEEARRRASSSGRSPERYPWEMSSKAARRAKSCTRALAERTRVKGVADSSAR